MEPITFHYCLEIKVWYFSYSVCCFCSCFLCRIRDVFGGSSHQ